MTNEERASLVRETIATRGWQEVIGPWLRQYDDRVTKAIKHDLASLPWKEKDKWFAIYHGQASAIKALHDFIDRQERYMGVIDRIKSKLPKRSLDT